MNAGATIFLLFLLGWNPHQSECLQCLLTTLTKERGTIYYTPSPSPQRLTKECSWEFKPPRNEEFVLVTRIASLSGYDGDDRVIMLDGNILDRQTVYDGRNELCFKYILDQSSSNDCLTKLAELHCSRGTLRRLIMPIRLSVSTRGRIESDPSRFHYTNFKLHYRYHYCPTENGRNIIIPQQSVLTVANSFETSSSSSSGVLIFLVFMFALCIPAIVFLVYKILSTRKKKQKRQISKKNAEIEALQAKAEALQAKTEMIKTSSVVPEALALPPYNNQNPAQVYYSLNGQNPPPFQPFPPYLQQNQAPAYGNKTPLSMEDNFHRVTFQDGNDLTKNESSRSENELHSIDENQSYDTFSSMGDRTQSNTSYDRTSDTWGNRSSSWSSENENYIKDKNRGRSRDKRRFRPYQSESDLTADTSYTGLENYKSDYRQRSRGRSRRPRSYPYDRRNVKGRNSRNLSSRGLRNLSDRDLRSVSSRDYRSTSSRNLISGDERRYARLSEKRRYPSSYRSSDRYSRGNRSYDEDSRQKRSRSRAHKRNRRSRSRSKSSERSRSRRRSGRRGYQSDESKRRKKRGRSRGRKRSRRSRSYDSSRSSRRKSKRRRKKTSKTSASLSSSGCCCEKRKKRSSSRKRRRTRSEQSSSEKSKRSRSSSKRQKRRQKSSRKWRGFSSPSICEGTGDSSYATAAALECCDCLSQALDEQLCRCATCQKICSALQPSKCYNEPTAVYTTRTRDFPCTVDQPIKPISSRLMPCSPCSNRTDPTCSVSQGTCFLTGKELSSGSDTSCSHAPAQTCLVSKYDAINNNENCNAAAAFMFWMAMCMNYKAMQAAKRLEKFRATRPFCQNQLRKIAGPIPRTIACLAQTSPKQYSRKNSPVMTCSQQSDSETEQSFVICEKTAKPILKGKRSSFEALRKMFRKRKRRKERSRLRNSKSIEIDPDELCEECPLHEIKESNRDITPERRSVRSASSDKRRALHVTISETFEPSDLDQKRSRSRSREKKRKSRRSRNRSRDSYEDDRSRKRSNRRSREKSRHRSRERLRRSPKRSPRRYREHSSRRSRKHSSRRRDAERPLSRRRLDHEMEKRFLNEDRYRSPSAREERHLRTRSSSPNRQSLRKFDYSPEDRSFRYRTSLLGDQEPQSPKRESSRRRYNEQYMPEDTRSYGAYDNRQFGRERDFRTPGQHLHIDAETERIPTRSILQKKKDAASQRPANYQAEQPIQIYPNQQATTAYYPQTQPWQDNSALQYGYTHTGTTGYADSSTQGQHFQAVLPVSHELQASTAEVQETIATQNQTTVDDSKSVDGAESSEQKPRKRRRRRRKSAKSGDESETKSEQGDEGTSEEKSSRRSRRRRKSSHKNGDESENKSEGDDTKTADDTTRASKSGRRRRSSRKSKTEEETEETKDESKTADDKKDGEKKSRRRRSTRHKKDSESNADATEEKSKNENDNESGGRKSRRKSRRSKTDKESDEESKNVEDKSGEKKSHGRRRSSRKLSESEKEADEEDSEKRTSRRSSRRKSKSRDSENHSEKADGDEERKSRRSSRRSKKE